MTSTPMRLLTPTDRLEDVLLLPLGTVFEKDGKRWVFTGWLPNRDRIGHSACFTPEAHHRWMTSTYALVEGGFRNFPQLANYLEKDIIMKVMISNPAFPKDRTKAKALSPEQMEIAKPILEELVQAGINGGRFKTATEEAIRNKLRDAGKPLEFDL